MKNTHQLLKQLDQDILSSCENKNLKSKDIDFYHQIKKSLSIVHAFYRSFRNYSDAVLDIGHQCYFENNLHSPLVSKKIAKNDEHRLLVRDFATKLIEKDYLTCRYSLQKLIELIDNTPLMLKGNKLSPSCLSSLVNADDAMLKLQEDIFNALADFVENDVVVAS